MAIKLTNKANTDGVTTDWPFGKIRNKTSSVPGTPVNEQVYQDVHQFFEKLMNYAGISHNNLPDNQTNTFQLFLALQKAIALGAPNDTGGAWIPAGTLTLSALGTITVDPADIVYNRYKLIGKTLHWQIQLRNVTIGGSPTSIVIDPPSALSSLVYSNNTGILLGGVYNSTQPIYITLNGGTGANQIRLNLAGFAAFTNGTNNQNFDINIICELN